MSTGKGKPPKDKQFKPGQSGNPAGKKPGTLSLKTYIKKWLLVEEQYNNPITGKKELLTQYDIIALMQIAKARKGDTRAFVALSDRADGKPKQSIDIDQSVNWEGTKTYVDYKSLPPEILKQVLAHTKEHESGFE